jgi:hypothetical protein
VPGVQIARSDLRDKNKPEAGKNKGKNQSKNKRNNKTKNKNKK